MGENSLNVRDNQLGDVARKSARLIEGHLREHGTRRTWLTLLHHRAYGSHSPDRKEIMDFLRNRGSRRSLIPDLLSGLNFQEVSILYEYSLASESHTKRKSSGQYFTPDDVAYQMACRAKAIDQGGNWIDPCCGVGVLTYWLAAVQDDPANFLIDRMYLADIDPLALIIASVMLTLELGEDTPGVFRALLTKCNALDFLSEPHSNAIQAILNPPYVVTTPDERFECSSSRDMYAYFLESVIKHYESFVAITPQSFTNGFKFSSLRKLMIRELESADIYCFDNVPDNIFKGVKFGSQNTNKVNSTRAAITVGTKRRLKHDFNHDEKSNFCITPLLRWRAIERSTMLNRLDDFLTPFTFLGDIFPKISRGQDELYQRYRKDARDISRLITNKTSEFQLFVPSTPRYFISATKSKMQRSSMHVLNFPDESSQNLAYLVMNSDLAYWWWRVSDGGMSLSRATLLSTPVTKPNRDINDLILKLETSESVNLVVKRNAGMLAENIKHPEELIQTLGETLLGDDYPLVCGFRTNSDLNRIN